MTQSWKFAPSPEFVRQSELERRARLIESLKTPFRGLRTWKANRAKSKDIAQLDRYKKALTKLTQIKNPNDFEKNQIRNYQGMIAEIEGRMPPKPTAKAQKVVKDDTSGLGEPSAEELKRWTLRGGEVGTQVGGDKLSTVWINENRINTNQEFNQARENTSDGGVQINTVSAKLRAKTPKIIPAKTDAATLKIQKANKILDKAPLGGRRTPQIRQALKTLGAKPTRSNQVLRKFDPKKFKKKFKK